MLSTKRTRTGEGFPPSEAPCVPYRRADRSIARAASTARPWTDVVGPEDGNERIGMNVDPPALRERLDERVDRGRTRAEAAAEVRWLVQLEQTMGILSEDAGAAAMRVIENWGAQADVPAGAVADKYARFLDERVRIKRMDPPPWDRIDVVWAEWRRQGGG
jgi:hypothetical protein